MKKDRIVTERQRESRIRRGRRWTGLGFPADADCCLPTVTLTGCGYVKVEHHTGVLQLDGSRVRLCSKLGLIRIEGQGLVAADMDGDVLLLEGRVKSVVFE